MQEENIQLQRNVTQMDEKNITLTAEITRFKEANDLLSGNLERFNGALASIDGIKRQIQDAQRGLAAIREDTQKESERYTQLNQESGRLQGAIATETKHLQEIASRFEVYASSLQASSADNRELVQQLRDIVLTARTYAAVQYPQRILVS
jgi:chromosome segregation ATPase